MSALVKIVCILLNALIIALSCSAEHFCNLPVQRNIFILLTFLIACPPFIFFSKFLNRQEKKNADAGNNDIYI